MLKALQTSIYVPPADDRVNSSIYGMGDFWGGTFAHVHTAHFQRLPPLGHNGTSSMRQRIQSSSAGRQPPQHRVACKYQGKTRLESNIKWHFLIPSHSGSSFI